MTNLKTASISCLYIMRPTKPKAFQVLSQAQVLPHYAVQDRTPRLQASVGWNMPLTWGPGRGCQHPPWPMPQLTLLSGVLLFHWLCDVASQQATSVDCIPRPLCRNSLQKPQISEPLVLQCLRLSVIFLKATIPDDNKRAVTGVAFRPQHRPTLTQW